MTQLEMLKYYLTLAKTPHERDVIRFEINKLKKEKRK